MQKELFGINHFVNQVIADKEFEDQDVVSWVVAIANGGIYALGNRYASKNDEQYHQFAEACSQAGDKKITILLTTHNPTLEEAATAMVGNI